MRNLCKTREYSVSLINTPADCSQKDERAKYTSGGVFIPGSDRTYRWARYRLFKNIRLMLFFYINNFGSYIAHICLWYYALNLYLISSLLWDSNLDLPLGFFYLRRHINGRLFCCLGPFRFHCQKRRFIYIFSSHKVWLLVRNQYARSFFFLNFLCQECFDVCNVTRRVY